MRRWVNAVTVVIDNVGQATVVVQADPPPKKTSNGKKEGHN